jgi:hypothetical protein
MALLLDPGSICTAADRALPSCARVVSDSLTAIGHALCTASLLAECVPSALPQRRVVDARMSITITTVLHHRGDHGRRVPALAPAPEHAGKTRIVWKLHSVIYYLFETSFPVDCEEECGLCRHAQGESLRHGHACHVSTDNSQPCLQPGYYCSQSMKPCNGTQLHGDGRGE